MCMYIQIKNEKQAILMTSHNIIVIEEKENYFLITIIA